MSSRTASARKKSRRSQTTLRLEQLEDRRLMTAATLSSLVAPNWFADYTSAAQTRHAGVPDWSARMTLSSTPVAVSIASNTFDWIVEFDTAALTGIASAAQTASLLESGGVRFEVLRGLGLQGQVLLRSSGADADSVADVLRGDADVASYALDGVRQFQSVPNDPQFSQLWGLNNSGQNGGTPGADIHAPAAWNLTTGSRNVVVAVLDTGVDYNHSDLAANMWGNSREIAGNGIDDDGNGFLDDVRGYNFVSNTGNPMDDAGHGTHVAGTIGAAGNNGSGVVGVNWSVSIMALKFLDASGAGFTSDAIRGVNYATMMRTHYGVNLRVINASWGGGGSDPALHSAIQAAGNAGILFVAAAGNNGTNNDTSPQYPGNYDAPNVLSVAATDRNNQLASFSCYGAHTVDLAAPGVSIYSTYRGNSYGSMSGTSMATPHVSGVAALAWSLAPNATVAQIRSAILQGVDQVPALAGKVLTGGRLNAYNTLRLLSAGAPQTPSVANLLANPGSVTLGANFTLTAQGVLETNGTIASVSFYFDSNANGQWDAADQNLGTTATIANAQASLLVSSNGLAAGSYRYFARAMDANGQWSEAAATTVAVTPPSDRADSPARAILATAPGSTAGNLADRNDVNYFKFQAVAGQTYTLQTNLDTLYDSVLMLYGQDGHTLLASNDDISSSNYASRIVWRAPSTGTFFAAVGPYASSGYGTYTLRIEALNSPPVMAPIPAQTVLRGGTLSLVVNASDPEGAPLDYSASAMAVDPVAQRAFVTAQRLGLRPTVPCRNNARGWQERYIGSVSGTVYFIVPNGTLYRMVSNKIARSQMVARFTPAYHANTRLLSNAQPPVFRPAGSSVVNLSWSGNTLLVRPSATYTGNLSVWVGATDGQGWAASGFSLQVTAPAQQGRANSRITPAPATRIGRSPLLLARAVDMTLVGPQTAAAPPATAPQNHLADNVLARWRGR